jgi:hypothetical protein
LTLFLPVPALGITLQGPHYRVCGSGALVSDAHEAIAAGRCTSICLRSPRRQKADLVTYLRRAENGGHGWSMRLPAEQAMMNLSN